MSLWVGLLATQIATHAETVPTPMLTATWLDNNLMQLHVQQVTGSFGVEFLATQATNKPGGLILDLRSADGDKNATAAASGFFASKKLPLVILVNGQTRGAAATLATDLRAAGDGVLVGSTDFTGKILPDITVTVSSDDEKNYLANPFFAPIAKKPATLMATNELLPFVDHTSEADLVRKRVKDGEEEYTESPRVEPDRPVIHDPALARAVDLLKALAVLHPARG